MPVFLLGESVEGDTARSCQNLFNAAPQGL